MKNPQNDQLLFQVALGSLVLGLFVVGYVLVTEGPSGLLPTALPTSQPAATLAEATPAPTPTPTHALPVVTWAAPSDAVAAEGGASVPRVGEAAPEFTLKTLDGQEVALKDLRGKVVWLNFWASWCIPCRKEMPAIQAVYEKFRDKGLVVLGVNYTSQEKMADVTSFVKELGLTFPILLDEKGEVNDRLYGLPGLPVNVFIKPDGTVARLDVGPLQQDEMETVVTGLLP